jgi:hypothetical protein
VRKLTCCWYGTYLLGNPSIIYHRTIVSNKVGNFFLRTKVYNYHIGSYTDREVARTNENSKIVDYTIKSRSESFCAKARDWRPTRSRGQQLGEAQED